MTSTRRAVEASNRHAGNEQYGYWGSLTNSAYNVVSRHSDVPVGGTKSKRWYQKQHTPSYRKTPGPGTYDRGVNDTTFKRSTSKSPTLKGTLGRSRRDWHVVRHVSPGPGEYERLDDGTFDKRYSGEPLNDVSQSDFRLQSLRHRRRRLAKLADTERREPMALSSAQRHQLRTDGSGAGRRRLDAQISSVKQQARAQRRRRQAREAALNKHKRAPFLTTQKDRFFHPLAVRASTPGPGTHSAHPKVASFWAATQQRAPKFGASTRPPLEQTQMHSGVSAFVSFATTAGPGSYTPDLTATVPDGRPRTTGEVIDGVLAPRRFGYTSPEQVFAESSVADLHGRLGTAASSRSPFTTSTRLRGTRPRTTPSPQRHGSPARPAASPVLPAATANFNGVLLNTVTGLPVTRKQLRGPKHLPLRLHQRVMAGKASRAADRAEASREAGTIQGLDAWERSKIGSVMGE